MHDILLYGCWWSGSTVYFLNEAFPGLSLFPLNTCIDSILPFPHIPLALKLDYSRRPERNVLISFMAVNTFLGVRDRRGKRICIYWALLCPFSNNTNNRALPLRDTVLWTCSPEANTILENFLLFMVVISVNNVSISSYIKALLDRIWKMPMEYK